MKVRILFFGATREAAGASEIEMDLAGGEAKAGEVFKKVLARFPAIENHKLLFAVNQEYSKGDETIKNGDELAVFTAVSGG